MPYRTREDLPKTLQKHLPVHAQEIYKEAFNHALEEYENEAKRRPNTGHAETAHKVAWSAVKKAGYQKQGEDWVKAD